MLNSTWSIPGPKPAEKASFTVFILCVMTLAGCLGGFDAASPQNFVKAATAPTTISGNRSDARWFQLVLGVDEDLSASEVNATVTIHWGTDASGEHPPPWFCAHWGRPPQPVWQGSAASCTWFVPNGRQEASVEAMGEQVSVDADSPICCRGSPRSSTVNLTEYLADVDFDHFRSYNISVVHFLVFGGRAPIDAISYRFTLPHGTAFDWATGQSDEPFAFDHDDFSSTAGVRVDTIAFGQVYAQEEAHLTTRVTSGLSAYVWYFPYWWDDYATNDPRVEVQLPGGQKFVDDSGFVYGSDQPGTWRFAYSRSADFDADRPIIMGTPLTWLSPDRTA